MVRVNLDLENKDDLQVLGTTGWKIASGLVPGEPNQGLVAEILASPARLPDYDDSWWDQDADFQERRSVGFTFAWYRLHITTPDQVRGTSVAGTRMVFETNVDNYGEIYIDGVIDRAIARWAQARSGPRYSRPSRRRTTPSTQSLPVGSTGR